MHKTEENLNNSSFNRIFFFFLPEGSLEGVSTGLKWGFYDVFGDPGSYLCALSLSYVVSILKATSGSGIISAFQTAESKKGTPQWENFF